MQKPIFSACNDPIRADERTEIPPRISRRNFLLSDEFAEFLGREMEIVTLNSPEENLEKHSIAPGNDFL